MKESVKNSKDTIAAKVYSRIESFLQFGGDDGKAPMYEDWNIQWAEIDKEHPSIWSMGLALYKDSTYKETFMLFYRCGSYATLARGDIDCIQETANEIADFILHEE